MGVVVSPEDLSACVWLWHRDGDRFAASKVITIPAEPADPETVAEEGYWGTVSFIDFLNHCRIEGTWKIVNKIFVHVAGEPPA